MSIDSGLFEENERMMGGADHPTIAELGDFKLQSGDELSGVQAAYHHFGPPIGSAPIVLICHAISGDSNAAAWWSRIVGPGKPVDTDKYTVLCSNVLGGCQGTSGPSSNSPDGNPYGSRFPLVTIEDMIDVQKRLMDHLGVTEIALAAGGSMGGMQAIEWSRRYPNMVRGVWPTASALRHGAMQIGFNEAARQCIMRDPKWLGGDYPLSDPPIQGLAAARMIGHLTYLSEGAFETKFGRHLQAETKPVPGFDKLPRPKFADLPPYQIESYLQYQGEKFTQRFDANSFIVVSNAIDRYSCDSLEGAKADFLVTSFTTDWIYPTHQSQSIADLALAAGLQVDFHEIDLPFGHDAFLLDDKFQGELVREFLDRQRLH